MKRNVTNYKEMTYFTGTDQNQGDDGINSQDL